MKIKVGLDKNFYPKQDDEITFYDFVQIDTSIIHDDKEGYQVSNLNATKKSVNAVADFRLATRSLFSKADKRDHDYDIEYSPFGFVQLGQDFEFLRDELNKSKKVFIPGSLVGIHSFLTIIENSIRNVKHYKHHFDEGDNIRLNGLTLLITLEQRDLFDWRPAEIRNDETQYQHRIYRMGVALGHKHQSNNGEIQKSLNDRLKEKIVDQESGRPKLGGTAQDKICSAMLLNGKFISVESEKSKRDLYYYPWIEPKELSFKEIVSGVTYSKRNVEKKRNRIIKGINADSIYDCLEGEETRGEEDKYVFKFFNLWVSEEIIYLNTQNEINHINQSENKARFKFGVLKTKKHLEDYLEKLADNKEEKTIFRLITSNKQDLDAKSAYKLWNQFIFNTEDKIRAVIYSLPADYKLQPLAVNQAFSRTDSFINNEDLDHYKQEKTIDFFELHQCSLIFAHGNNPNQPKVLNYRSHGVLAEKFSNNPDKIFIKDDTELEFIETILYKVNIWDDRIFERVEKNNTAEQPKYSESLKLNFFRELEETQKYIKWNQEDLHTIYIIHLSFIEFLKKQTGEKNESDENIINWFVKRYFKNNEIDFRNITITIVSGRGNAEWFDKTNPKFLSFIIYRPVESVLDAIEDALIYGDDFQLKYNICKAVIGS